MAKIIVIPIFIYTVIVSRIRKTHLLYVGSSFTHLKQLGLNKKRNHYKISLFKLLGLLILISATTPANSLDLSAFSLKRIMGEAGMVYDVEITGIEPAIAEQFNLEAIAKEAVDEANPPQNLDELMAVSGLMAARITDFLQAQGYYDANTRSNVKAGEPPLVQFDIRLKRQYQFAAHQMLWQDAPPKPEDYQRNFPKTVIRHGLIAGEAINNQAILNAANDIRERLMRKRCYLDLQITPKLVLDRLESKAEVTFKIKHQNEANFGKTNFNGAQFSGKTSVKDEVLQNYVTWKEGECFNSRKIDATSSQMLQSRLLARVDIEHEPAQNGVVNMKIDVTDRPHRTFTAGGYYATDEGVGTRLGWEHRNLHGLAHRLTTKLTLTGREKSGVGQYTIPFFMQPNQNLQLSASAKQETTDAFDSSNVAGLVALERYIINPEWLVGAGSGVRIAKITDVRGTEDFAYIYAPAFMQWDSRDDLFDAQHGVFARGSISPYIDAKNNGASFIKSEVNANIYLNINDLYGSEQIEDEDSDAQPEEWLPYQPIIALRGAYGQINGANGRKDIPADLRFYAGGGGSVRGYNFQAIGEREAGLPAGGTIKSEFNAELRLRFNEQFGAVAFVDGGNVYDGNIFDVGQKLYLSAGAGVRYFSPIGPLRFDLGVPLDDVEDAANFGVYISIGQAF